MQTSWGLERGVSHLGPRAPVEPAHVGGVSEEGVDPAGDQHVTAGLFVLHDVVEVGAGGQHGCLAEAVSTQNHEQTQEAHPLQLLQL